MADPFLNTTAGLDSPAINGAAITPHADNDLAITTRAIYVGGAGNLAVIMAGGTTLTFVGLAAGTLLPIRAKRVLVSGTTATSLIGLY